MCIALLFLTQCTLSEQIKVDFQCVSPIKFAEPLEDAKLFQVITVLRHGARAPFDNYINYSSSGWECEGGDDLSPRMHVASAGNYRRYHGVVDPRFILFKPSCRAADLVIQGQKQHNDLGKAYREHYINRLNFLPTKNAQKYTYFRASDPERCFRSAQCFINGMFPPKTPDSVSQIVQGTPKLEILQPYAQQCSDLAASREDWLHDDRTIALKKEVEPFLKWIADESDLPWNDDHWLWIGDWLYTIFCNDQPLPDSINQTIFDHAMKALNYFTWDYHHHKKGVAGSQIMREVLRIIDEKVTGNRNVKFALLAGHDITITSLLDFIDYKGEFVPPFRSHLDIELWKRRGDLYIRFVLNGDVISTEQKLSNFKSSIAPYLNFCQEFP